MEFEKKQEEFRKYYDNNIGFLKDASRKFKEIIEVIIENIPTDAIQERVKTKEECIKKFERKYLQNITETSDYQIQDYITDLLGVRIICLYESDIEFIKKLLENDFDIVEETNKTESLYKSNGFGYKGLHLDLSINSPRSELSEYIKYKQLKFEVQIRTVTQHAWSAIEHKLRYKGKTQEDKLLERKINRLAALFEMADAEFVALKASQPVSSIDKTDNSESDIETLFNKSDDHKFSIHYFLGYVRIKFKDYPFIADEASEFVESILIYDPNYTRNSFKTAMQQKNKLVNQYREYTAIKMNPYTILRHTLYCSDKSKFQDILRKEQKLSFDEWLKEQS